MNLMFEVEIMAKGSDAKTSEKKKASSAKVNNGKVKLKGSSASKRASKNK